MANRYHGKTRQYLTAIQHYTICINMEQANKLRGDSAAARRYNRLFAMRELMLCLAVLYMPEVKR